MGLNIKKKHKFLSPFSFHTRFCCSDSRDVTGCPQILANISRCPALRLLQNVYRSTVTDLGLAAVAAGAVRSTITHITLSLNTHSQVAGSTVRQLLLAAPQLRVLELGGAGHTKSLYFQVRQPTNRPILYYACRAETPSDELRWGGVWPSWGGGNPPSPAVWHGFWSSWRLSSCPLLSSSWSTTPPPCRWS